MAPWWGVAWAIWPVRLPYPTVSIQQGWWLLEERFICSIVHMKAAISTQLHELLTEEQGVELAEIFRLMGDPTRLRIILLCVKEPICVRDIAAQLGVEQSLVSHHLRLLKAGRVLRSRRQGKQMFYSVADEHISCVVADMVGHVVEPVDEHDG